MWPRGFTYRFHFTHLQLAMRRFYRGPKYGVSTDSLFYIEVITFPCRDTVSPPQEGSASKPEKTISPGTQTALTSFDARICPAAPSLCLRMQVWSVAKRQDVSALSPEKDLVGFCRHADLPSTSDHVRRHVSAYQSGSPEAAEYGKCIECITAWRIEVRDFGAQEVSLIMTRWIDLGPGLIPQDPRWRSHIKVGLWDGTAEDNAASPRLRFETGLADGERNNLSDEGLYSHNASLLKGRKYMDVMERIPGGGWRMRPSTPRRRSGCVVL